ncbi:MAG: hypothetical protein Q8Q33_01710 [Chlamydiota bacterium]|nr:hypothetical protein [Chlamydiota bacterium]
MKIYTTPCFYFLNLHLNGIQLQGTANVPSTTAPPDSGEVSFPAFTQISSAQILIEAECFGGQQGFEAYNLGNISTGASLQISAVTDACCYEDFIIRVLNPDNTIAVGSGNGCIDNETGTPTGETASFTASQSGTYQIHVNNKITDGAST